MGIVTAIADITALDDEKILGALIGDLEKETADSLSDIKNSSVRAEKAAAYMLAGFLYSEYSAKNISLRDGLICIDSDIIKCQGKDYPGIRHEASGRPYLEGIDDLFISISHTKDMVMCSLSDVPSGVDIQKHVNMKADIAGRFFPEDEAAYLKSTGASENDFFDLWCMHEAYVKYTGRGFSEGFKDISFIKVLELTIGEASAYEGCFAGRVKVPAGYSGGVIWRR